ncbi:MAG: ATP synthase F1 subunit epsilon [Armatimonadota bacterium]
MASSFSLSIVTPERTVLDGDATSLQVMAAEGSLGVLPGHAPMLAQLGAGECVIRLASGEDHVLAIAGGFVDVSASSVTVLADTAEFADEIDADRAEAALGRAREMLGGVSGNEREEALAAIRRAQARLRVARRS